MRVYVFGAYRSGISLVERLTGGIFGCTSGGNSELNSLCTRIFASQRSDRFRPLSFNESDVSKEHSTELLELASDKADRTSTPAQILTDPRLSLLSPPSPSSGCPEAALLVIRNPLEVSWSLCGTEGFPPAFGLALWEYYTATAVRIWSNAVPVHVVNYNALMCDPGPTIDSLTSFLCETFSHPKTSASEIESLVDASQYHHRDSDSRLDSYATAQQYELYKKLIDPTSELSSIRADIPDAGRIVLEYFEEKLLSVDASSPQSHLPFTCQEESLLYRDLEARYSSLLLSSEENRRKADFAGLETKRYLIKYREVLAAYDRLKEKNKTLEAAYLKAKEKRLAAEEAYNRSKITP